MTKKSDIPEYHSVKAYYDNLEDKVKLEQVMISYLCVAQMRGDSGLSAQEIAMHSGLGEHKSIGAALSRAKKKYPNTVGYRRREGQSHGEYYFIGKVVA